MRQIDNMNPDEIETLRFKGMLPEIKPITTRLTRTIDRNRVQIQLDRISACDLLLDYVHDDIPHKNQQPITDQLNVLRGLLQDEMDDALSP